VEARGSAKQNAGSAIVAIFFALAQSLDGPHFSKAFQASSPKNFYGLAFGPALFSVTRPRGAGR
jgi:hypothetical protein